MLICPQCRRNYPVRSVMRTLEAPNIQQGPYQRRQLAISDPKEQKMQPDLSKESLTGQDIMPQMADGPAGFDITMYPGNTQRGY